MSVTTKIENVGDFNHGAINEIVQEILPDIFDNLADENTNWATERGFDIKVRMKLTGDDRETMVTKVEVVPKLASPKPHESTAHLISDGGHVSAFVVTKAEQKTLDNVVEMTKEAK